MITLDFPGSKARCLLKYLGRRKFILAILKISAVGWLTTLLTHLDARENSTEYLSIVSQLYCASHFLKTLFPFMLMIKVQETSPKSLLFRDRAGIWTGNSTLTSCHTTTFLNMTATSLKILTLKCECEKISGNSQFSDKGTGEYMAPQISRWIFDSTRHFIKKSWIWLDYT